MKKLFGIFCCMLAAGAIFASTCETRVDNKWDKTTQERIDTCLNEEQSALDEAPKTKVIVSDVSTAQYPKAKAKKPAVRTVYKKYAEQESYKEYVDQEKYPKFKNDFVPAQSAEVAHETAMQAMQEQRQIEEQPVVKKVKKAKKKPAAVKKVEVQAEEAFQEPEPAPTYTPPAEIQQAHELEDNLTAPDTTTNDPFLSDDVLESADFGYNDTDPALQQ